MKEGVLSKERKLYKRTKWKFPTPPNTKAEQQNGDEGIGRNRTV
jgi:hypothetical protein